MGCAGCRVDRLRVRLQMSISRLSLSLGPVSLSLSSQFLVSLSLYIPLELEMSRDPGHHRNQRKPGKGWGRAISRWCLIWRGLIGWDLETISWQLPGRAARPHHTTKILYMLHHDRRVGPRPARPLSALHCNNNPAPSSRPRRRLLSGHLSTGILPDQDLDSAGSVFRLPDSSLIIASCPAIVRRAGSGSCHKSDTWQVSNSCIVLYGSAHSHRQTKGELKQLLEIESQEWLCSVWVEESPHSPPWTCLLSPDWLPPSLHLSALESGKMNRNLEMSQRYPGPATGARERARSLDIRQDLVSM